MADSTDTKSQIPPNQPLSEEVVVQLVEEHRGWAESIARCVARAWDMDWRNDGLDGAAMEALIYCARRFDPARGVPFKGYARRRIHEASTEEARKSKKWRRRSVGGGSIDAREVSAQLYEVFPELREEQLPLSDTGSDDARGAIRSLLMGASLIVTRHELNQSSPDDALDVKRMVKVLANLEPLHQALLWRTYWEDRSLRALAEEWETDELNIIREHKAILHALQKGMSEGKSFQRPRIRPALRDLALKLKRKSPEGPFSEMMKGA